MNILCGRLLVLYTGSYTVSLVTLRLAPVALEKEREREREKE